MNFRSGPPPLLVSYTDLCDVWSETGLAATENDAVSTLNLQQVPVKSQNLAVRLLKDVQTRLVKSSACERLCVDWGGSPASWFRQPVAELVTWRCADWDGWKKNFRLQLRAMAQARSPTDPVPIFVFVTSGPLEKSAKAVLDAVQKELSPRTVVHLGKSGTIGMQDLLSAVKAALVQSLEGRVAAYRAEIQKTLEFNPEGGEVDVGALYVLKDSLGALFESTGMYQEACNEYSELEAMIEDCVARAGRMGATGDEDHAGGKGDDEAGRELDADGSQVSREADSARRAYQQECSVSQVAGVDECRQLWNAWDGTRRAVAGMARDGNSDTATTRSFIDFVLIPSIVCNMVRLLMKDSKRVEALRVCRTFISNHRAVLARYERRKKCPIGMEMAWAFSACVSSVLRVCMDVEDPELLEDIGLLDRLVSAVRDEDGRSKIAKMNSKFHLAVGHLLLEARDVLMALPDGGAVDEAVTKESVLDLMRRVDVGTFSTKPSSLTPQHSLSTPRASAMASMASMISNSTHHEAGRSMENIDLDHQFDTGASDLGGDRDNESYRGSELHPSHSSHQRSISLHQPTIESAFSSGSISATATADSGTLAIKRTELSLLEAEAAIDGHAAPLLLLLGREDEEVTLPWIPTYRPFRLIYSADSGASEHSHERFRIRSAITSAANAFFERCGYHRNAGVLSMQLAEDAYVHRDFATSSSILLELSERLEEENWAGMYEDVLLRLARSQMRDGDDGLVRTCHRLLRLHCNETYASMLVRAAELAAHADQLATSINTPDHRLLGGQMGADAYVLSLNPCLHVVRGPRARSSSMHFVGDCVDVSVGVVNTTGICITLNGIRAVFKVERRGEDAENLGDPAGTSLSSPHLQHLKADIPSPSSPSSPFFSNYGQGYGHGYSQSPTNAFNAALRGDASGKLSAATTTAVGELSSGETTVTISASGSATNDVQHLEFVVNPIVSGTYTLVKLEALIEATHVEITPANGLIQLQVEPPEPRIRVDTVTRTLIAGEVQWLGIEVDVLRDDTGPPTAMNVEWASSIHPSTPSAVINGNRADPDDRLNVPNTLQYHLSSLSSTVWWRAKVGKVMDTPPEDVRVPFRRTTQPGSSDHDKGIALHGSHRHPNAKQQSRSLNPNPKRVHHLPVSILFEGVERRCSRVASASASVAVDLPFLIRTDAREVREGVILVTMHITSSLAHRTVMIHGIELRPQHGFSVLYRGTKPQSDAHIGNGGTSIVKGDIVAPMSSMCASFVLKLDEGLLENRAVAQATVYRTGKLAPSVASISYSVVGDESDPILCSADGMLPPQNSTDVPEVYLHEHAIALQLSAISTDSSATNEYVSLRMLGPFSAIIGCPVTVCWQLERVGGPDEPPHGRRSSSISYEVVADASSWSKCSRAQGSVSLGKRSGSIATIEMAWTPTTVGAVPVPSLRLHDVYYVHESRGRSINVSM